MKRLLLFLATTAILSPGFAQETISKDLNSNGNPTPASNQSSIIKAMGYDKTSGLTDTFRLASDSQWAGTTRTLYADYALPLDSGSLYGNNALGYKGFAQHYFADFDATNNNDTQCVIIGYFSRWGGNLTTGNSTQFTFSTWLRGTTKTAVTSRPKFYVYGLPTGGALGTKNVVASTLNNNGSATFSYLSTPINVTSNIYVGYTRPAYTWVAGDSVIGLRCTSSTPLGTTPNYYTIETATGDTLVTANNVIQDKNGVWTSTRYTLGVTNGGDQIIAPMIKLQCPLCGLGVSGFHSSNLTFYGNYPNPAVTSTTVKFALRKSTEVTFSLYDITGKLISSTKLGNQAVGEHTTNFSVADLSSGNYIYVMETSDGDALAAQLTVAK